MIFLGLVFSLLCGVGNALEQNEIGVSVVFTSQSAYPGSGAIASVYLVNNSTDILTIQYMGIHFDWMPSDQFLGYDLSDNPVVIPNSANHIFDSITIIVPADATLGEHSYFVGIDGFKGTTDVFSWNSQVFTLEVEDPEKEAYNVLLTQVSNKITASEKKIYQSSKAQSLLDQAVDAYEQALVYGNQNSWDEAVSMLNSASTYIEQADFEEQKYLADKGLQETLPVIIGVVVVVVVIILVMIYLMKRRKGVKS